MPADFNLLEGVDFDLGQPPVKQHNPDPPQQDKEPDSPVHDSVLMDAQVATEERTADDESPTVVVKVPNAKARARGGAKRKVNFAIIDDLENLQIRYVMTMLLNYHCCDLLTVHGVELFWVHTCSVLGCTSYAAAAHMQHTCNLLISSSLIVSPKQMNALKVLCMKQACHHSTMGRFVHAQLIRTTLTCLHRSKLYREWVVDQTELLIDLPMKKFRTSGGAQSPFDLLDPRPAALMEGHAAWCPELMEMFKLCAPGADDADMSDDNEANKKLRGRDRAAAGAQWGDLPLQGVQEGGYGLHEEHHFDDMMLQHEEHDMITDLPFAGAGCGN